MRCAWFLLTTMACAFAQNPPTDSPADPPNVLLMKLQADPDNQQVRRDLMNSYLDTGDKESYLHQILWLIENRPDSPLLSSPDSLDTSGYEQAEAAFATQLNKHADSPSVLFNAARFAQRSDPIRSVDLLEQARKVAANQGAEWNYARREGWIYASAIPRDASGKPTFPLTLQKAETLQASLMQISDPELLMGTGLATQQLQDAEAKKLGLQLMEKAIALDPGNKRWQDLLDRAKNGSQPPSMNGPVRIGGNVAEANLIEKVAPVYPPIAKSARVSGTVEFNVTIDKSGAVQNLQLVRGHPLLVSPAKDAVLQWRYRPTLLNGNPVEVITSVIVTFSLNQ